MSVVYVDEFLIGEPIKVTNDDYQIPECYISNAILSAKKIVEDRNSNSNLNCAFDGKMVKSVIDELNNYRH